MRNTELIDIFANEIAQQINSIDFTPIFPQIATIVQTSIDRNFSSGGRFGSGLFGGGASRWTTSRRAIKQSGQTLQDTGQLAASIRVNIHQSNGSIQIEIGSNKPYAAIHQFGGTIKQAARSNIFSQKRYVRGPKRGQIKKGRKNSVYDGKGTTFGERNIKIIARPYLVLQDEDVDEIMRVVEKHIANVMN